MSQSVPQVTGGEVAAAAGFLGAGIGYIMAPKRYNLEDLLTVKPDVFEKAIDKKSLMSGTEAEKNAFHSIYEARSFFDGHKTAELVRTPKLENAYKIIRKYIPRARVQYAVILGILAGVCGAFVNRYSSRT